MDGLRLRRHSKNASEWKAEGKQSCGRGGTHCLLSFRFVWDKLKVAEAVERIGGAEIGGERMGMGRRRKVIRVAPYVCAMWRKYFVSIVDSIMKRI